MKQKSRLLTPPGEIISAGDLQVTKAKQFVHYLGACGALVRFLEVRKINEPHSEVVVFQLKIERPQRLAHKINRLEPLAAIFSRTDDRSPEVISLRPDFPSVPHLNLTSEEFPRSICLYQQTFEQTRLPCVCGLQMNAAMTEFALSECSWFCQTIRKVMASSPALIR